MKKNFVSTELFSGKNNTPDFIKNHAIFKKPVKVQKVFPSIGLPNFRDKANIDKCLVDVKKEGSYVHNLLKVMTEIVVAARDSIAYLADKVQYLDSKEAREASRAKITDLYLLSGIITALATCVDPYNKEVLADGIQISEGKVNLKLMKDIPDANGKMVFRKDESLFKIFNKIKDKCAPLGLQFQALDQTDAFKIFSKENIPNKEFSIIFSSEGPEGAWDIATMSMRGIKSCQRWDGEYPGCLIGSILSKFVGVMYLTSGVQADNQGAFTNLGTKMMRRCVIRYAIDADEGKPCILVDKMYPEIDKDIMVIFMNAIKSRTSLPVYYAQELGNKLRHIYLPAEKIREDIADRELSYQDTPLKSKHDLNVYTLNHNKDEIEREVRGYKMNLALFIARRMENVYTGNAQASDEIKKTISNIRMNTSFTPFCEQAVNFIISTFRSPASKDFLHSRLYYRKYLMEFLMKRKQICAASTQSMNQLLANNTSRTYDMETFQTYLFSLIAEFTKSEITKLMN